MKITGRVLVVAGSLALAGAVGFGCGSAHAQTPGTYEEAPFQQGSLMYRPSGRPKPPKAAPRRATAPVISGRQAGYSYSQTGGYAYYGYAPQPGYVYAPPAGTYYVQPQPRRGLFGWFR